MTERLIRQNCEIGIVSSNSESTVRKVLGPVSSERVSYYRCGVGMFGKRRALKRILTHSGFKPEQAIYIGDETRDGEAAQGAGIAFGAVSWGFIKAETLQSHGARHVFRSMDEISVE